MTAAQQLVVDDKAALDAKVKTLRAFCGGPNYRKEKVDEQHRLARQLQLMAALSQLMGERIAGFNQEAI